MNYFLALFSILVGLYSLPIMINFLKNKETSRSKVFYYCSCFLFITFPLVNFANALDILFFKTYEISYFCGAYGLAFILSSFFIPNNKVVGEMNDN